MSMDRIPLDWSQVVAMQAAMRQREEAIIDGVLQQPDYPPLPACPECGTAPERIAERIEEPKFGVDEDAVLVNIKPCGHRFRAVVELEMQQ